MVTGGPGGNTVRPTLTVGELLSLAQDDYLYGFGAVRFRVTEVPERQNLPGFLEATGFELSTAGSRKPGERTLFVREDALDKIRALSNVD
ncbi:hypothetical protein [Dactylosporangium sp. NPDC051541]|uniref:hypothetical protein n=1 Tax=Dactylosporangium sp. NPDC051541 TaxID=3363977 RepID=UPI00379887A2